MLHALPCSSMFLCCHATASWPDANNKRCRRARCVPPSPPARPPSLPRVRTSRPVATSQPLHSCAPLPLCAGCKMIRAFCNTYDAYDAHACGWVHGAPLQEPAGCGCMWLHGAWRPQSRQAAYGAGRGVRGGGGAASSLSKPTHTNSHQAACRWCPPQTQTKSTRASLYAYLLTYRCCCSLLLPALCSAHRAAQL